MGLAAVPRADIPKVVHRSCENVVTLTRRDGGCARHNLSMRRCFWVAVLAGSGWGVGQAAEPPQGFEATVTRVVDGDSVWVRRDGASPPLRLRLVGVDAPEICQTHGEASREALAVRLALAGYRVRVTLRGRDRYERWLAELRTGEGDVATWLVRQGHAWNDGPHARDEKAARGQRLGLFEQRNPERPRDFRRRHGPCPFS